MQLTHDHEQIRDTLKRYIDEHINPHVDEWEEAEIFPAHQVFKDLGNLGLLGLTKPVEYGGMGLDYSYSMVMAETLGLIRCGGVPMAIGVQTDMCTPALAPFGSDELKREDGDDYVISGEKMWITNSLQADWMCMLVNTSDGPQHKNKSLVMVPMRDGPNGKLTKGIEVVNWLQNKSGASDPSGLPGFIADKIGRAEARRTRSGRVALWVIAATLIWIAWQIG